METRAEDRGQHPDTPPGAPEVKSPARVSFQLPVMAVPLSLEGQVAELKRQESILETPWTRTRIVYRAITTVPVALSPFFGLFVYQSIAMVRDMVLEEFGEEDNEWAMAIFTMLAIHFSVSYFLGDPPSVNPVEESENLLWANALEEKDDDRPGRLFAHFNKALALPCFAHFGADNALGIAGLAGKNSAASLGFGIPITLFSVAHQHVVTKRDIEVHSHRFIQAMATRRTAAASLLHLIRSPLKTLEVLLEGFSQVAHDGIACGYIAIQLAKVCGLRETDPEVFPWMLSASLLTAYNTSFSKILRIYDDYFNPEFETLTPAELRNIELALSTLLMNAGIALTRAGPFGWFVCRFGPEDPLAKGLLASGVCLATFAHPLYVLYQKQVREVALAQRRQRNIHVIVEQELAKSAEGTTEAERLFNQLALRFETRAARRAVTFVNSNARIAQFLAFLGFVANDVQAVSANGYNLPLRFGDMIALTILWCSPIAIKDGRANQEPLLHSLAYHRTKLLVGAPTDRLAEKNRVTRLAASFFYSKGQFSKTRLRKAMRVLDRGRGEEEEMESLVNGK